MKKSQGQASTNCLNQCLKLKVLEDQVNLLVNLKRPLALAVMILLISLVWALQFHLRADEKMEPYKIPLGQATTKSPTLIQ
jgi:hypothetical protein